MTSSDMRLQLRRLLAERADAADAGRGGNVLSMDVLQQDLEVTRAAYVGLAVTEIASLRSELGGPLVG